MRKEPIVRALAELRGEEIENELRRLIVQVLNDGGPRLHDVLQILRFRTVPQSLTKIVDTLATSRDDDPYLKDLFLALENQIVDASNLDDVSRLFATGPKVSREAVRLVYRIDRTRVTSCTEANTARWQASGLPEKWIAERKGEWTHSDWMDLSRKLETSEYWPVEIKRIGAILEEKRIPAVLRVIARLPDEDIARICSRAGFRIVFLSLCDAFVANPHPSSLRTLERILPHTVTEMSIGELEQIATAEDVTASNPEYSPHWANDNPELCTPGVEYYERNIRLSLGPLRASAKAELNRRKPRNEGSGFAS